MLILASEFHIIVRAFIEQPSFFFTFTQEATDFQRLGTPSFVVFLLCLQIPPHKIVLISYGCCDDAHEPHMGINPDLWPFHLDWLDGDRLGRGDDLLPDRRPPVKRALHRGGRIPANDCPTHSKERGGPRGLVRASPVADSGQR